MKRKKIWISIKKDIGEVYPFVLMSIGCMFFGYTLSRPMNSFTFFLLLMYLFIASVGGSIIDKRLKEWR